MDAAFLRDISQRLLLSRDKVHPRIEKTSSLSELAEAMKSSETEAAVFESEALSSQIEFKPVAEIISICLNSFIQKIYNDGILVSNLESEKVYLGVVDSILGAQNIPQSQINTVRKMLHFAVSDMLKTLKAFRGKRVVRHTARFVVFKGPFQDGYHPDISPAPEYPDTRIVRTYVGPPTLLADESTQEDFPAYKDGATVALRLGKNLDIWHASPPLRKGEIRLCFIVDLA